MNKVLVLTAALVVPGLLSAAETELPARRVESVSATAAESTAPVASAAVAATPAAEPRGSVSTWLQLQSSGRVASPVIQGQTATEREMANQRFLDSYEHPIPEFISNQGAGLNTGGSGN